MTVVNAMLPNGSKAEITKQEVDGVTLIFINGRRVVECKMIDGECYYIYHADQHTLIEAFTSLLDQVSFVHSEIKK